jgi:hypothetical protein
MYHHQQEETKGLETVVISNASFQNLTVYSRVLKFMNTGVWDVDLWWSLILIQLF